MLLSINLNWTEPCTFIGMDQIEVVDTFVNRDALALLGPCVRIQAALSSQNVVESVEWIF